MRAAKQATLEMVQEMPEGVSFRTILSKLAYLSRIEEGIAEAERGDVVPNAQSWTNCGNGDRPLVAERAPRPARDPRVHCTGFRVQADAFVASLERATERLRCFRSRAG